MMIHTFTLIFLAFLLASTLMQLYLSLRQTQHVSQHRPAVPAAFAGKVSLAEHQKAADYTLAKSAFGRIELLVGMIILLGWTLGGGLGAVDAAWRSLGWSPLYTGTAVILTVLLLGGLLDLPASLYRTFVLEQRFGFNKMTLATFVADTLKSTFIALAMGIPLVMLILWLMDSAGALWWLYAWLALTAFSLLVTWAYPHFIAPLFNRFTPLTEGEVAQRLDALLKRTGFSNNGVFVMDGSRRSAHGNAYFTGFGKHKRIVFFDTLLQHLTPAQIEAILAHELGHYKRRHILKGMLLSMTLTLVGFAVLAWLLRQEWFYTALGVAQPSAYMALLLFVLVSPVFLFFVSPLLARWSRRHEFEADAFAVQQSSAAELITALVGLYRENASTLTPDPLYSAFHDSHPPASIRIAHLQQQSQE